MTVYVDSLMPSKQYRKSANERWNWSENCHMTADTVEELHAFAARLNFPSAWFQGHHPNPLFWHYDLSPGKRTEAVHKGAQEITLDQWCERVGITRKPAKSAQIPPHPDKCDCCTPIWRYLDGQWKCLNCPLHDAIYESRDDVERVRLLALIDATRPEKAGKR